MSTRETYWYNGLHNMREFPEDLRYAPDFDKLKFVVDEAVGSTPMDIAPVEVAYLVEVLYAAGARVHVVKVPEGGNDASTPVIF